MTSVKSNQAKSTHTRAEKTQLAINPETNIAVFASAGSGKTHLLVHRILKLLLSGVEPAHILAITFTRKAASEMHERLMKVLAEWVIAEDSQVKATLQSLSHPHDDASIAKARKLYEELLFSEYEMRITTFHAFCQDILKRFAIHAGVPAGFQVAENNEEFKTEARKRLYKAAQSDNGQQLSSALFTLLRHCSTVNNVNEVLDTFIDSRSDWRSFTEEHSEPEEYAEKCLRGLIFPNKQSPQNNLDSLRPHFTEYMTYLSAHNTKTYQTYCTYLSEFLEHEQPNNDHLEIITPVFFTSNKEKRVIKISKTLEKSLGEKTQAFITLHDSICERIDEFLDIIKKENLIEFNQAWFYAGHCLLTEYQALKFSQHTLDFDDLEWYTYLLLNKHDSATWIQYKLDQRIQHVLIDEFQDTNPTQWNLLFPLLNELAADSHDNHRSLFLVGDAKQSIYGFRRANPDLQRTAAEWAETNLKAQLLKTDDSYRSSPAVIDFVNLIFSQEHLTLPNFKAHQAIRTELWGNVQVNQLTKVEKQDEETEQHGFRNPLTEAKENFDNDCHYLEGQQIANKIYELINTETPVNETPCPRQLKYSDIIILARNRTHLAQLELALSEKHIPFISSYDGDFINRLEVQDIISLLTYLIQSHNDLALAQVLRSPLYGLSDQELMGIASQDKNSWHEKLKLYAENPNNILAKQAFEQLQTWRKISNSLPVHDLLDHIYFKADLLTRYENCLSNSHNEEFKNQVSGNLIALLQLSLDLDSGRYSSIQSFLTLLQNLQSGETSGYTQLQHDNAVQIMTIHSAKGLEAPVVFLVDTGPKKNPLHTYKSIINWPSSSQRPEQFFLVGRKDSVDRITQSIIDQETITREKEELNLLYVALTRAKQFLYISGSESKQSAKNSWHSIICSALDDGFKNADKDIWEQSYGTFPQLTSPQPTENITDHVIPEINLSKPFPVNDDIAVDTHLDDLENKELADYGVLVHKIFELSDYKKEHNHIELKLAVESSLGIKINSREFEKASQEVNTCLESKTLNQIFTPSNNRKILREVPINFIKNENVYYRIIDHLIIEDQQAWIIDYKTSREVDENNMGEHALQHQQQINTYIYAMKKLHPEKKIRASILFTAIPALYDFDIAP